MSRPIRVRFAPSPTGYLHVGGARTALYNYLYARKMGGTFILRIEDTDQARSTEESLQMQIGDLKWLGLNWDEGPGIGGDYGPYKQSERRKIYDEHAQRLLDSKKAFRCFCTDAELEEKKQQALKESRPPHYDGKCRNLSPTEVEKRLAAGEKAVVRFHVSQQKEYILKDLIRGDVNFPSGMVGDFVILRSDGMPVYNFCCVVDDALMKISHVLRAEEHLSNTVRQMMLYEAFDYELPLFGHLSIILGSDRQKLSKRHGATSCFEYKTLGYLPEALNNFIALLGWSSPDGKEVMSPQEMTDRFSLDRFTPSAAVFDEVKLKWMNATHLRALDHKELWKRIEPYLNDEKLILPSDEAWRDQALTLLKTSMETLKDCVRLMTPLSDNHFVLSPEGTETLSWPTSRPVIEAWRAKIANHAQERFSEEDFTNIQNQVQAETQNKGKNLFMPIRVAVIGKPQGAELKQLVPLLPKKSLLYRADKVLGC